MIESLGFKGQLRKLLCLHLQDLLATALLQKKGRLLEKAGQHKQDGAPNEASIAHMMTVEIEQRTRIATAIKATHKQQPNPMLEKLLKELFAGSVL